MKKMDTRKTCARCLGMALVAGSFAVFSPPVQVAAQAAQTADAPALDDERLTQYATLHHAIGMARDEFQAAKASVHDESARDRLRHEMDERLAALYEEHGMPKAQYDEITFRVSIDNDLRTRLEEILATLGATDES
jgi:hypothetical protein